MREAQTWQIHSKVVQGWKIQIPNFNSIVNYEQLRNHVGSRLFLHMKVDPCNFDQFNYPTTSRSPFQQ